MKNSFIKNGFAIILGLLITAFIAWLYVSNVPFIERLVAEVESSSYDLLLQNSLKKLPPIKNNNIVIVAIDDDSIKAQGRWPWSRKKMAELTKDLGALEVSVIAYDIIFSEAERNIINETLDQLHNTDKISDPSLEASLKKLVPFFNYDKEFGDALNQGDQVLGYAFKPLDETYVGILPPPLTPLNKTLEQTAIPVMTGYLANINVLQTAAKNGGFVNSDPDPDGVLRNSNLVFIYKDGVYPSLSLEATRLFLLSDNVKLVTSSYNNNPVLEGVQIDEVIIPTDDLGRMLIPYRVGAYAYPYFSATDILEHRVSKNDFAGKLVFIGATATGLGDLQSTSVAPSYPGVEVHASIASAILDKYFPSKPVYGRGLEFILIVGLGILAAFIFPFLSAFWLAGISVVFFLMWYFVTSWLWVTYAVVFTFLFPLVTILLISFMNMVNSYLVASRQKKEIKSVFGQYVPQKHIDTILKSKGEDLLKGESRELTVLFSDIRGFTTLSEKMTATELKLQLNEYLTSMTGVIFEQGGTIDKYVGDMIMAFWNAPIMDEGHAKKAVLAGLAMQAQLTQINQTFAEKNLPSIHVGVGINTGMINVGDMGSKYRRAYTAIGDSVNLASRLEGMCRQYESEILVGEQTYEKTKDEFLYMHVDKVKVKGKNVGVDIYWPLKLLSQASPDELKEVQEYHEALAHYFNSDWDKASEIFEALSQRPTAKDLYTIYLNRVREYKVNPPASDWDGAYVSLTK